MLAILEDDLICKEYSFRKISVFRYKKQLNFSTCREKTSSCIGTNFLAVYPLCLRVVGRRLVAGNSLCVVAAVNKVHSMWNKFTCLNVILLVSLPKH